MISDGESALGIFSSENGYSKLRKVAFENWKKCPPPSARDEYWKYTRLNSVLGKSYLAAAGNASFDAGSLTDKSAYNLVFINGVFAPVFSESHTSKGLTITDLASARAGKMITEQDGANGAGDYFSLLNKAFHINGPFISIGRDLKPEKEIHIHHIITEKKRLINIRGLVEVADGGSTIISEHWYDFSSSDNLLNISMNYRIGENSHAEFTRLQSGGIHNAMISQVFTEQAGGSRFNLNTITAGTALVRNNISAVINGRSSHCSLNGFYRTSGQQHVDNHTAIDHALPDSTSSELYKGIAGGKSKAVFNGKVIVRRDAQKTNAFQYNGNVVLGDDAQVFSKPELEIFADDVKCSHGSTTGKLDEEAIFYLRSRGIGADSARELLLKAFAAEVLEHISSVKLRESISNSLAGWDEKSGRLEKGSK